MSRLIEIDDYEAVQIHNAVIFMANDLMEEIVELESWLKDPANTEKDFYQSQLEQLVEFNKRYEILIGITNKVK